LSEAESSYELFLEAETTSLRWWARKLQVQRQVPWLTFHRVDYEKQYSLLPTYGTVDGNRPRLLRRNDERLQRGAQIGKRPELHRQIVDWPTARRTKRLPLSQKRSSAAGALIPVTFMRVGVNFGPAPS